MRRLLNAGFGQLAVRARRLDLRIVMNDLCELCMEQVCAARVRCKAPSTQLGPGAWPGGARTRPPAAAACLECPMACLLCACRWAGRCACSLLPNLPRPRQLELYRDTRESILLATQQPRCLRDMAPAARDRAFRAEMRAERNLHPALQAPAARVRGGAGPAVSAAPCGPGRGPALHGALPGAP